MNDIYYPDSGNPLEDAAILSNTVNFSTGARAYSAQLLLNQPLNINQQQINYSVVRAYEEFMASTEDLIGWLFVLEKWQPGNAEFCLFNLLDKIQVGKNSKDGNYTEKNAESILNGLDAEKFRRFLHIPEYDELIQNNVSKNVMDSIRKSMPAKLDGWRSIAQKRTQQDRGWVRLYNKCKHHMLMFPTEEREKKEVWAPISFKYDKQQNSFGLERGWIGANIGELRGFVRDAIIAQAVLHDTLALILITRFGFSYRDTPKWILDIHQEMK